MNSIPCELLILGMPLDEEESLSRKALEALKRATLFVGESKRWVHRTLAQASVSHENAFFLDNMNAAEWEVLEDEFSKIKKNGGVAVLFSDAGMPILFDPGKKVLELCKKLQFEIHTIPSATSWGTAAAVSGFDPPFEIVGFLSNEESLRKRQWADLSKKNGALVLLETPYRYRKFLKELLQGFGNSRLAFLAWEIAKKEEKLIWGTLGEIAAKSERLGLQKGEFVIVVAASSPRRAT